MDLLIFLILDPITQGIHMPPINLAGSTFNFQILLLTPENSSMLKEVKKPTIFEPNSQVFDKEGLFSTDIFGPIGSELRKIMPGYIDLNIGILHPQVYLHIITLGSIYNEVMAGTTRAKFDPISNNLVPVGPEEEGDTGFSFFLEHMEKIQFVENESSSRKYKLKLIEQYAKQDKLLTRFFVLPAGLRDYTVDSNGRGEEDEVNTIYRKMLATVSMIKNTKLDPTNIKLIDPLRYKLQLVAVELYNYYKALMDGKSKYIQGKWAKRAIMYGTRNVITPSPIYISDLKSDNKINVNQSVIGTFQFIKGIGPIAMNRIHSVFINRFLNPHTDMATLINPKTMETELVSLPIKKRDEWLSIEGLNTIINKLSQDVIKVEPVKINGYYLMLIYDDGKNVKYFFNTDEITPDMDKQYIRPITYIELMYMSIYDIRDKYPAFLTRYPVAALGGIYPTYLYVKTTINGRTVQFTMDGVTKDVVEYPKLSEEYMNSVTPHITHVGRLGAD